MSKIPTVTQTVRAAKKRPFRVSIEGNIGSGKSTCIKYFDKFPIVEKHAVRKHCLIIFYTTLNILVFMDCIHISGTNSGMAKCQRSQLIGAALQ